MRLKLTCKSLLQLLLAISITWHGTILHHFSTCGGNWYKIVPYRYYRTAGNFGEVFNLAIWRILKKFAKLKLANI